MRRHLLPYLAFMASLVLFVYLLRGADSAVALAAVALALLIWWWAAELLMARQHRKNVRKRIHEFEDDGFI